MSIIDEVEEYLLQQVTLNVIAVSESHLDKMALCPGSGTRKKGQDKLPEWLMSSAKTQDKANKKLVGNLILNWDNSNNNILSSDPTSEDLDKFLLLTRGSWIKQLPKF